MRFVATTTNITIGPGAYLRIVPEDAVDRPRRAYRSPVSAFGFALPPVMPVGSVVLFGREEGTVLWADGPRAVVALAGRSWLLSHMTPSEMALHRDAYEPGSLVQEWIIRRLVEDASEFGP